MKGKRDLRSVEAGRSVALVLALLLLALGFFKLIYSLETQSLYPHKDGGYYTNIARNVRDGNGVTTNISLFHKAYSEFPHRTSVYPLWPLLHGLVARGLPILKVGVWLPTLFYFSALLLAFLWAQRLLPGPLLERIPWLRAGHVLVLMLGLHQPFFHFTSLPYTEGLAYTLLFAALWRTWPGWPQPGLWRGLELGLWLGVLLLARGQFLLVALAAFGALVSALVLVDRREGRLAMLLGAWVMFGAIAISYWLYLSTFVADAGWSSLFRFDSNRESDLLSPIRILVQVDGVAAYLADRALGFLEAFSSGGKHAYARSYHVFHYALIAAMPLVALEGARWLGPKRRRRAWAWLRSSSSPGWVFLALLAAGGFLSIHSIHKMYGVEWYFATRQGLACLFLFFLALVYLLRARWKPVAVLGLCLTLAGSARGFASLEGTIESVREARPGMVGRGPWRAGLVAWLLEQRREHGDLTVAIPYPWPQRLAFTTPGVNYHWVYWTTTLEDIELMFGELGVRYLLVQRDTRPKPAFLRPRADFFARFEKVGDVAGFRVFVPRSSRSKPDQVWGVNVPLSRRENVPKIAASVSMTTETLLKTSEGR